MKAFRAWFRSPAQRAWPRRSVIAPAPLPIVENDGERGILRAPRRWSDYVSESPPVDRIATWPSPVSAYGSPPSRLSGLAAIAIASPAALRFAGFGLGRCDCLRRLGLFAVRSARSLAMTATARNDRSTCSAPSTSKPPNANSPRRSRRSGSSRRRSGAGAKAMPNAGERLDVASCPSPSSAIECTHLRWRVLHLSPVGRGRRHAERDGG